MASGAYDGLFGYHGGAGHPWYETTSDEARAWLKGLADLVAVQGEPNWAAAHRMFCDKFPTAAPSTDTTLKATVRRLVKERG